jgi:hypothetical protein
VALTATQVQAIRDAEKRLWAARFDLRRVADGDPLAAKQAAVDEYAAAGAALTLAQIPLGTVLGGALPAQAVRQYHLRQELPVPEGTPGTLAPSALGATTCRVFPFRIGGELALGRVLLRTLAALANGYRVGIFDEAGARRWESGPVTTVVGLTVLSAGLPVTLPAGTYFLALTNNGSSSSTAALQVSAALPASALPRWGTVATAAGAMPAAIAPAAIAEAVGGFPVYATLSEWAT